MTWVHDTLHIASQGLLSNNSHTIASQGFIVEVTVDDVTGRPDLPYMLGGGGTRRKRKFHTPYPTGSKAPEESFKLITATVTIAGKKYVEKAYTNDLSVTAKDIDVHVTEDKDKPTIKITLL